jgi:hypothetical protein
MTTHYVYELLNREGQHLYIGCSKNIGSRLNQHKQKPWWSDVTRIEIDQYPTAETGFAAEADLIRECRPTHNTYHVDDRATEIAILAHQRRRARQALIHERDGICDYQCVICTDRLHAAKAQCGLASRGYDACTVCVDYEDMCDYLERVGLDSNWISNDEADAWLAAQAVSA